MQSQDNMKYQHQNHLSTEGLYQNTGKHECTDADYQNTGTKTDKE